MINQYSMKPNSNCDEIEIWLCLLPNESAKSEVCVTSGRERCYPTYCVSGAHSALKHLRRGRRHSTFPLGWREKRLPKEEQGGAISPKNSVKDLNRVQ